MPDPENSIFLRLNSRDILCFIRSCHPVPSPPQRRVPVKPRLRHSWSNPPAKRANSSRMRNRANHLLLRKRAGVARNPPLSHFPQYPALLTESVIDLGRIVAEASLDGSF